MTKKEIAILEYLEQHPDFLAQNASRLGVRLTAPNMRQMQELHIVALEHQLEEWKRSSVHNQEILHKMMAIILDIMRCNTLNQLADSVIKNLRDAFGFEYIALCLTQKPAKKMRVPKVWQAPQSFSAQKIKSHQPMVDVKLHFSEWENTLLGESFLHLPLHCQEQVLGLLLIGHPNPRHFSPEKSNDYVCILGEAIGTTLARIVGFKAQ